MGKKHDAKEFSKMLRKKNKQSRFSRKTFDDLLTEIANDVNYETYYTSYRGGEPKNITIPVTKKFRKWCYDLLVKAGMDKVEAAQVLSEDFEFNSLSPFYDLFVSAMYEYMDAGYAFNFHSKEDFIGTLSIVEVPEKTRTINARSPITNAKLGTYEITKKKHKGLRAKAKCPKTLTSKKKID